MRNSTFKPRVYERRPVVVKPIERAGIVRAVSEIVHSELKVLPVRSESYRRWVASLPCIVCGLEGSSQAAHPNMGRGKGQKASDLDCFPLCSTRMGTPGHHWEHDNLFEMTLEERRERERRYAAKTQELARQVRRPELKEAA
jgi:hypothetical protein